MKVIHSIVALTLIAAASEAQERTEVCHTDVPAPIGPV